MSTLAKVRELRAEATDENQIEKIWEAIEAIARKADAAPKDAVRDINNSLRAAGL